MKRLCTSMKHAMAIVMLLATLHLQGQTVETVHVPAAGSLNAVLGVRASRIADLKLTGIVDSRDFVTLRDNMPLLESIDLSEASIAAYKGKEGTWYDPSPDWIVTGNEGYCEYAANAIPQEAFVKGKNNSVSKYYEGKKTLRKVIFPTNLTAIEKNAFRDCSEIELYEIANLAANYTSADGVLYSKDKKKLVLFPPAKIGAYAFPVTLTAIEEGALNGCRFSLLTFNTAEAPSCPSSLNASVVLIKVPKGSIERYAAFRAYPLIDQLNEVSVSVKTPGTLADQLIATGAHPTTIHKVTVSGELNKADFATLNGMRVLYSVDFSATTNVEIPDEVFMDNGHICTVTLPNKLERVGWSSFFNCPNLMGRIVLPETVSYIGGSAFQNTAITEINFPARLTTLEGWAFRKTNLRAADLSACSLLGSISELAFKDCFRLRTVFLPSSVSSIGKEAFYRTNLHTISFPATLQGIDASAFYGCPFSSLQFPKSLVAIGNDAFNSTTGVTTVDFSLCSQLKSIGDYAFYCGTNLKEVDLSSCTQLKRIGCSAFASFVSSSVIITPAPKPVPCGLEKIVFPSSLEVIGSEAFYSCKELHTADLSVCTNLQEIEESAFMDCDKLKKVSLPASLLQLKDRAYSGCTGITDITCQSLTPPAAATNTFEGVSVPAVTLNIPNQTKSKYLFAPVWQNFTTVNEIGYLIATKIRFTDPLGKNSLPGTVRGEGIYTEGSEANVTATAFLHYKFTGWMDEENNLYTLEETYSLKATRHQTLYASFALDENDPIVPNITLVTKRKKGETVTMTIVPTNGNKTLTIDFGDGVAKPYTLYSNLSDFNKNKITEYMPVDAGTIKIYGDNVERLYVNSDTDYADMALTELILANCPSLTWLYCYNNELTELDLKNCPILSVLSCGYNYLGFSSFFAGIERISDDYANQGHIQIPQTIKTNTPLDLSRELTIKGGITRTTFAWTGWEYDLIKGTDYTEQDGVFTFLKESERTIYCVMKNADLPEVELRTSNLIVQGINSMDQHSTMEDAYMDTQVKDQFVIKNIVPNQKKTQITLYSLNGQILQQAYTLDNEFAFPCSELSAGSYIIKLITGNRTQMLRAIKQ